VDKIQERFAGAPVSDSLPLPTAL